MSKKNVPMMVVQSKMKEQLASQGMRSSGDVAEALNTVVVDLLAKAVDRCKANNRSTVRASDL